MSNPSKPGYQITEENCRKMIRGVCPRCGKKPVPVETVDNANEPTFWAGCCSHFTWGVDPTVQKTAALLVAEGWIEYEHMEQPGSPGHDYEGYEEHYRREQIAGTCQSVSMVLAAHKKAEAQESEPTDRGESER